MLITNNGNELISYPPVTRNRTSYSNEWKLMLDVSHFGNFKPNEVGVRLLENEVEIEITGKQNWRPHPGGSLRREFAQRHGIPRDIDKDSLKAHMTKEGRLVIKASRITVASIKGYEKAVDRLNQLRRGQVADRSSNPIAQVTGIRREVDNGSDPIIPFPPKPRSIHKDVLFQDVTRVFPV